MAKKSTSAEKEEEKKPKKDPTLILKMFGKPAIGGQFFYIGTEYKGILLDAGIGFQIMQMFSGMAHSKDLKKFSKILDATNNKIDFDFLTNKIAAIFISHGHLDHIGLMPYLLSIDKGCKIVMGPDTKDFIALSESESGGASWIHDITDSNPINIMPYMPTRAPSFSLNISKKEYSDLNIEARYWELDHSVVGAGAFLLDFKTSATVFRVLYLTDYRLHGNFQNRTLNALAQIRKVAMDKQIDLLITEGTNIPREDQQSQSKNTTSKDCLTSLNDYFTNTAKGLVLFGAPDKDLSLYENLFTATDRIIGVEPKVFAQFEKYIENEVSNISQEEFYRRIKVLLPLKNKTDTPVQSDYVHQSWIKLLYNKHGFSNFVSKYTITAKDIVTNPARYAIFLSPYDQSVLLDLRRLNPDTSNVAKGSLLKAEYISLFGDAYTDALRFNSAILNNWLEAFGVHNRSSDFRFHLSGHIFAHQIPVIANYLFPRATLMMHTSSEFSTYTRMGFASPLIPFQENGEININLLISSLKKAQEASP